MIYRVSENNFDVPNSVAREIEAMEDKKRELRYDDKKRVKRYFDDKFYRSLKKWLIRISKAS